MILIVCIGTGLRYDGLGIVHLMVILDGTLFFILRRGGEGEGEGDDDKVLVMMW